MCRALPAAVLLTEVDGVYALVLLGVLITIIFIGAKKIGILEGSLE